MNKRLPALLLVLVLLATTALADTPEYTVACMGDSLTFGLGAFDPATESWPAVLGELDGSVNFTTENYGAPGCTIQHVPELDYTWSDAYWDSLDSDADIFLVMLGSNDLMLWGWQKRLARDYQMLLQSYLDLPQSPRVIVVLPPALHYKNRYRFANREIYLLREMQEQVAEELGLDVISLADVSEDLERYCIDGGHYDSTAYAIFGEYIYDSLCELLPEEKPATPHRSLLPILKPGIDFLPESVTI